MKTIQLFIFSICLALFTATSWSAPLTSFLIVKAFTGTKTAIPDNFFNSSDKTSGTKNSPVKAKDFLVSANNQLVLVLTFDATRLQGNLSAWSLEEWTKAANPQPFDRDPNSPGVQSKIFVDEDNYGRTFITKRLKDPAALKNASVMGASDLREADGSRFGPLPLGDHFGYFTFNGHLDKSGNGTIADVSGKIELVGDLLNAPQNDSEQAIFTLKITAANAFLPL